MNPPKVYTEVSKRGASCLKFQKRVAASILKCGPSKVWLDPNNRDIICKARTRESLKELINQNYIKYNVSPRKPKPGATPTEIANRRVLIGRKRSHKQRMRQKAEYHRRRAQEEFPMSGHPSLSHLHEVPEPETIHHETPLTDESQSLTSDEPIMQKE